MQTESSPIRSRYATLINATQTTVGVESLGSDYDDLGLYYILARNSTSPLFFRVTYFGQVGLRTVIIEQLY
jgi:hypothetical protein